MTILDKGPLRLLPVPTIMSIKDNRVGKHSGVSLGTPCMLRNFPHFYFFTHDLPMRLVLVCVGGQIQRPQAGGSFGDCDHLVS